MLNKNEKVAIVTGAAQGIGKAVALKFAKNGYRIVIVDISYDKLLETEKEIKNTSECLALKLNVSKSTEVKNIVQRKRYTISLLNWT